jgi:hypothetical protein
MEIGESVYQVGKNIGEQEALMFAYTLTKCHLFLLQRFENGLKLEQYSQRHPGLDWTGFFSS